MGKVTISELVELFAQKANINKQQAQSFIMAVLETISEGVDQDKLVKIKGLGTFKVVDVDARESINVNTGERLTIDSHQKLSFTPDSVMKDFINKPFSQFETVVLNEGVVFEDMADTSVESVAEAVPEPEPVVASISEPVADPEPEVVVDSPMDSVVESTEESVIVTEEEPIQATVHHSFYWLWSVVAAFVCVIIFGVGYLTGHGGLLDCWFANNDTIDTLVVTPVISSQDSIVNDSLAIDTIAVQKTDTVMVNHIEEQDDNDWEQYLDKDIRVRTGAYGIIGLDTIIKIRPHDTVERIARRTLGEDMECYIEVYNGITRHTQLIEGHEIKIPKLKLKKNLKRKNN